MRIHPVRNLALGTLVLSTLLATVGRAQAQGRSHRPAVAVSTEVTLTVGQQRTIQAYYAAHPRPDVEALPPGIRQRLARGKPLPPGIAKRMAPATLVSTLQIPDHYEIVEVGLDVLLVEVTTGIVHDILMDVIR